MIRTTNVRDGFIDTDNVRYVQEATFHKWTRRAAPLPGDVVLTREAPLGEVGIIRNREKVFLGQRTIMYRADLHKLDPYFLMYSMLGEFMQGQIRGYGSGSTVEHMRLPDCFNLLLPLPPLPTQHKIAAILSAYDDMIENNRRRIRLLEEMAQRIYREWFVDFRYPGHENGGLVDSALGAIPAGWGVVPLSTVCDRITDGAHLSPPTVPAGLPMASVKDMTPRRLALDACRLISDADFVALVRQDCQPRVNDVLIAKDGSYLKHVFVVRDAYEVVILSSIALLRPNGAIQPDVLALCLQQSETKERLKNFVSGVAIPRIVLKDFRAFQIIRPPEGLQRDLVQRVGPQLRLAFALDMGSLALRAARDMLLPRLISGEFDVTNLEIAVPDVAA